MPTIKANLSRQSNAYQIEKARGNFSIDGCSVIIPIYNQWPELVFCLRSLQRQKIKENNEIIIIDDNSQKKEKMDKVLAFVGKMPLKIFKMKKNIGAAAARNIGMVHAKYNLLVFLDCDMIVPYNFIAAHAAVHRKIKNAISVGFRKHTLFDVKSNRMDANIYRTPSFKSDFRYKKHIPVNWHSSFPFFSKEIFGRNYFILNETRDFKDFGFNQNVGIWTLPFMVVGSSMAVRSDYAFKVGGFDERFVGAWCEDTFFGAKLISLGLKVIPVKGITAYHLIRNRRNSNKRKDSIMNKNRTLYYQLINENLPVFNKTKFINKTIKKYGSIITQVS